MMKQFKFKNYLLIMSFWICLCGVSAWCAKEISKPKQVEKIVVKRNETCEDVNRFLICSIKVKK